MKRILLFLATMAAAGLNATAAVSFGGHYYDVVYAPALTWSTANTLANSSTYLGLSGHLVTITSASEDAFVLGLVSGQGEYWAGGFQNPPTETVATAGWTWVNGEGAFPGNNLGPVYANWNGGEPNDFYGPGSEQWLTIGFGAGAWNDEGAEFQVSGYVVEYQPVPEVSTCLAGALLGIPFVIQTARKLRGRKVQ